MSERITLSPTASPSTTSTVLTEVRPSFTWTRVGTGTVGVFPEQRHHSLIGAERRPSDEHDVVQLLEDDLAVDAQVGHRAARQLAVQ